MTNTTIIMIRGDTKVLTLKIADRAGTTYIPQVGDRVYFTVKLSSERKEPSLQKRYPDTIAFNEQTQAFRFEILPSDTDKLSFGNYCFDVEVVFANGVKQTIMLGQLKLGGEVTHAANEV